MATGPVRLGRRFVRRAEVAVDFDAYDRAVTLASVMK